MTVPPLRWGIISTANIGRSAVVPALHHSDDAAVVAVASRDLDRARQFARDNDIPQALGTYEALLDDESIDAVYNPLPNSMHLEWTLAAIEAGKHVLCEKPLGLTERECLDMADAAARRGVTLMEAFMYRFHPRTERYLELVRGHQVGPIRTMHSAFTFRLRSRDNIRLDPALGGGALMDVGCYCVNVSRTVMGQEPRRVHAVAVWAESGVDDRLYGTLEFPDGAVAQFDCALDLERREWVEATGPDGYLACDAAFRPGEGTVEILEGRGLGNTTAHAIDGADEFQCMVEHFTAATRGAELRYTAYEAAANMRVIEALYRSARERRPVDLD